MADRLSEAALAEIERTCTRFVMDDQEALGACANAVPRLLAEVRRLRAELAPLADRQNMSRMAADHARFGSGGSRITADCVAAHARRALADTEPEPAHAE